MNYLMMVTSLNKSDVLSIVVDPTRNKIIRRLDEAGKAAYSDLLDSADYVRYLTSTGNFNYHLSFLLKNSVIVKEGVVYKLTSRGREIARFVKDVDQMWSELE
jgi:DNA-binding transcriptional ArsR family regulator